MGSTQSVRTGVCGRWILLKTIYRNHRLYNIISRACDKLRCGFASFEILADRPLNHGHLVICRAWYGCFLGRIGQHEYRLRIDEYDRVYVIDCTRIFHDKRLKTIGSCSSGGDLV